MNGKQPDLSMQVPLVCPGKTLQVEPGVSASQGCGTNVFEIITVGFYTRHRLKAADRRFDQAVQAGQRFRCISCGHVLTTDDFNSPMSGPLLRNL